MTEQAELSPNPDQYAAALVTKISASLAPESGTTVVVAALLCEAADHHDYGEEDRAAAITRMATLLALDWRAYLIAAKN